MQIFSTRPKLFPFLFCCFSQIFICHGWWDSLINKKKHQKWIIYNCLLLKSHLSFNTMIFSKIIVAYNPSS
jgi:hypothetical protein